MKNNHNISTSINTTTLTELRDIMEDRFATLVESFFTSADTLMNDLEIAAAEGNSVEVKAASHSISSSCLHFGAERLGAYMRILKIMGHEDDLAESLPIIKKARAEYIQIRQELEPYLLDNLDNAA